ncbi:hypothetical protein ACVSQB_42635, partial [Bradyrhizobium elkanii]
MGVLPMVLDWETWYRASMEAQSAPQTYLSSRTSEAQIRQLLCWFGLQVRLSVSHHGIEDREQ